MDYPVLLSGFGVVTYARPVCAQEIIFRRIGADESLGQASPGLSIDDSSVNEACFTKNKPFLIPLTVIDKRVHFHNFARKAPVIFTMWSQSYLPV